MIKREEVETLLLELRDANQWRQHQGTWAPSVAFVQDHATRIEELARTWLRVNDAPVIAAQSAERAMFESNQMPMPRYGDPIKLVLVPEADSGGDRG